MRIEKEPLALFFRLKRAEACIAACNEGVSEVNGNLGESLSQPSADSSLVAYSELLTTSKAALEMPSGNFSRFNGEQHCIAMRLLHRKKSDSPGLAFSEAESVEAL